MLYAKLEDHRTSGSGEEDFKSFYHIWAWRPSWSCDLDHLHKLSFPLPKKILHKIWASLAKLVSEKKLFENNDHIHVYSPGTGADNPLRSNVFINSIIQSI